MLQAFASTLLHSLWQSALLAGLFFATEFLHTPLSPSRKLKLIHLLLFLQIGISIQTFFSAVDQGKGGGIFSTPGSNIDFIFAAAWIIGFAYRAGMLFRAAFRLQQLRNAKQSKIDPSLRVFTAVKAVQLGIKKQVRICSSLYAATPLTYGFIKPVILLPVYVLNNLSIAETEAIILHELAHIANGDYWKNKLLLLIDAIYFFNPAVRYLIRSAKREREMRCDLIVNDFGYETELYASALVQIARQNMQPALVLQANASPLLQRIRFLSNVPRRFAANKTFAAVISLCLLLTPILFAANVFRKEEDLQPVAKATAINNEVPKIILTEGFQETVAAAEKPWLPKSAPVTIPAVTTQDDFEELLAEGINAMPAAFEIAPDSVKDIRFETETQGMKIVQHFRVIYTNGSVSFEPVWILTETIVDSLSVRDTIY